MTCYEAQCHSLGKQIYLCHFNKCNATIQTSKPFAEPQATAPEIHVAVNLNNSNIYARCCILSLYHNEIIIKALLSKCYTQK